MAKRKQAAVEAAMDTWSDEDLAKSYYESGGKTPRVPEPSYGFKVGDQVNIGNLQDEVIVRILDGGRLYLVRYTAIDNNYGHPKRHDGQMRVWPWYDIDVPREQRTSNVAVPMPTLSHSNQELGNLLFSLLRSNVDYDPPYQRGHVWSQHDRDLLVQSVFEDRSIGLIVLRDHPYSASGADYTVVDGKQRLQCLVDYRLSRFPYRGYRYCDLSNRDQHRFDTNQVQVATLPPQTTVAQELEVFVRLNRGGKPMDEAVLQRAERLLAETKGARA